MKRYATLLGATFALSACATVKQNYTPETVQVSFPSLGTVQTATLGDQLINQGTATTTRGAYLPQQNNVRGYVLSSGFYPQTGEDDEYVFTAFDTRSSDPEIGVLSFEGGVFGQVALPRGIRFDKSKQETCVIAPNGYGMNQPLCDTEYPYQFTERPFLSANDFQQTLIYSGRVGNRIRISYREFAGNMARAAFTNEAEYDLEASDIIAYKGARIKVIDADNESIKYEVLSNFNM